MKVGVKKAVSRDELDERAEEAAKVRKIGLKELARDLVRAEPESKIVRKRKIAATDPYFAMLDSGRDFLLWLKKQEELRQKLPKSLGKMLVEMEMLMQKMHTSAIMDNFDYTTSYNTHYFNMMQAENLMVGIRYQVGRYMSNERIIQKRMGENYPKQRKLDLEKIVHLGAVCELMEKNIKTFMDWLEKEYDLGDPVRQRRKDTLAMTRNAWEGR